ncbi:hypothetical protein [Moraxella equi]|uniref:Uncharacterized protein n=1 Tax=Moraxella equi TaxID=60442 RepID=A0A378QRZ0_9GAMM|nr:hypothetical protein [Moraxella equi]OPH39656.1 hypothetical protein B5J93_03195 [Moraxella equi]STZ03210.1 Uncharacterised protein [Moraxella equi]
MKNPTSRNANRMIDVIFVHPKHRSYVIWHDGVFYQLTRMNLTQKAWDRRAVYDGLLDEIFVAKESCEQGETDECAWQELGLNVVKLPDELHSITASRFLAWWTVNRYSFWHAKDARDVSDKDVQNPPEPIAGQKPQQEVEVKPQVSASTVQQSAMDNKASKNGDVMDNAVQSNQTNQNNQTNQTLTEQTQTQALPKSTHKPDKPLEQLSGDDIFDVLLDDLVDEVSHLR